FTPLVVNFNQLAAEVLRPMLHFPHHLVTLTRFGLRAGLPAQGIVALLRTERARALFAGIAAHGVHPLERPGTAAVGVFLAAAGQNAGWPVAEGGSERITDALAAILVDSGGLIETGVKVTRLSDIPRSSVVLLDTSPGDAARIVGDRLPTAVRRAYERWHYGPAAFKLDLAVEGGVPWTDEVCCRAGTVHVGGTAEEIGVAEREVHVGRLPARPFVLVAQQYLCDATRSSAGVHPLWAYAHVPHGYAGDATGIVLEQIERFAPGFRERIVGMHVTGPRDLEAYDANYVGGDIATGANDLRQLLCGPRVTSHPYDTGIPGVYLCSAATPPGPGVHGMCGHLAALRALERLGIPWTFHAGVGPGRDSGRRSRAGEEDA
ncbi:MAG: phytoene desaturase family protein, partial [Acidimicrobiales bacterium]